MNNVTADQEADSDVSYSIIDEHRLLTDRIDVASYEIEKFFAAPANQTQFDAKRIIGLLEDLRDIAQTHFLHEETLMAKSNFPGAVFHKRDHDYLLKSLIHFTSSLSHGTVPFSSDIGVNLRSWMTYHIRKYDDAYVTFIEAANLKAPD
ncbi:MAG: hemerythrin family protein [Rhodomicrobium sp.]